MDWELILAIPMIIGMLVLIFADGGEPTHQTFGKLEVNRPASLADEQQTEEFKKAA